MKKTIILTLFISSFTFGQIGINTDSPTSTLDINGDLRIRKTQNTDPSEIVYNLVQNQNGVVKKVVSSEGNNYAFNKINFNLNNVNFDYVQNFDSKIPASDYTLIITGASFTTSNNNDLTHTYIFSQGSDGNAYNPLNLRAFEENGTWRILADYHGGAPKSNGNWIINTMAINNSVVKQIPDQTVNMNGQRTGGLSSKPAGL